MKEEYKLTRKALNLIIEKQGKVIEELEADKAELETEIRESADLVEKQSKLLTGVVNAIKGEPPELTLWSHHDAPALVAELVTDKAHGSA